MKAEDTWEAIKMGKPGDGTVLRGNPNGVLKTYGAFWRAMPVYIVKGLPRN